MALTNERQEHLPGEIRYAIAFVVVLLLLSKLRH